MWTRQKENTKLFNEFIRSKLLSEEQIITVKDSEGWTVETGHMYGGDTKFQSVKVYSQLKTCHLKHFPGDGAIMKSLGIVRLYLSRLMKELNLQESLGPSGISSYILSVQIDSTSHRIWNSMIEEGVMPQE